MNIRTFTRRAGVPTLGAAALVGVLAVGSVAAAQTYTVAVGTKTTGTATLSATNVGQLKFTNVTNGIMATCNSSTAKSSAALTKTASGTKVALIKSSTFVGCLAGGQLPLKTVQVGVWNINVTGKTSAAGVTQGSVTNIVAHVSSDSAASNCKFTLGGTSAATYNNSTGKLVFAPRTGVANLVISQATGNCFGLLSNGDHVNANITYTVKSTAPAGKLSIKSN